MRDGDTKDKKQLKTSDTGILYKEGVNMITTFVPALAIALLVKLVDFSKFLSNRDINSAGTQLVAWAAGIGVAFLFAQSQWADAIPIASNTLATLNGWSLIIVGLSLGSGGSVVKDTLYAVDSTVKTEPQYLLK